MPEIIKNPPVAEDFMEAARSFGNYSLALSLADLIDNSITAGAKNIWIDASYEQDEIRIVDDGRGMSRSELVSAMRMASRNPKNEIGKNELGRFGLGLKTASFAQADQLLVISKFNDAVHGAQWDLNNISDWSMSVLNEHELIPCQTELFSKENGTEVIWQKLTRLTENGSVSEQQFNHLLVEASDEIRVIFHRFMEGINSQKINIYLNREILTPFNPFYLKSRATNPLPQKVINYKNEQIVITPVILPHFSKMGAGASEYKMLAGEEGFVKNSGFYVYRENRLIIRGTWFKLFPHGELSKLARVMIDIPNSLDAEWKITVDKSEAQLPSFLKAELKKLIKEQIASKSVKVIKGKQILINSSNVESVWNAEKRQGNTAFKLNLNHSVLADFSKSLKPDQKKILKDIFKLIENSIPLSSIHAHYADNPDELIAGYTNFEDIYSLAEKYVNNASDKDAIVQKMASIYPFSEVHEMLIERLKIEGVYDG